MGIARFATAGLVLTALLVEPGKSYASDGNDELLQCKKKISGRGFPNLIESLAGLNAVKVWSETAREKHGAKFAMWHNAGNASLKCNKMEKSGYVVCAAIGKPCLSQGAADDAKQAEN